MYDVLERVLYKNVPLAKVPALLPGFEGAKEGCTYHCDDKVPAPTIQREIMFIRDTSYGVSSHFPSCGSSLRTSSLFLPWVSWVLHVLVSLSLLSLFRDLLKNCVTPIGYHRVTRVGYHLFCPRSFSSGCRFPLSDRTTHPWVS